MRFSTFCFACWLLLLSVNAQAQKLTFSSPNQKISVALHSEQGADLGSWYLKVFYTDSGRTTEAVSRIDLGLSRADQDFSKELRFLKAAKPRLITEQYTAIHGKRS